MAEPPGVQRGVGTVPTTDAGTRVVAEPSAQQAGRRDRHARRLLVALALIAAAVPLVVSMIVLLHGPSYEHYSDTALTELRTLDVGHHTPQLGPFSRFTWTHPGPMLFLLLAGPYRLAGTDAAALGFASLLLAVAGVAIAIVVAARRGPSLVVAVMGVVLVLERTLGAGTFVLAWNPWVTLLPLLAYVLLAWAAAEGSLLAVPAVVAVGTFLVQSHLEYAPMVIVGLGAAGYGLWANRDATTRRRRVTAVVSGALLGLVLWLPPLLDQISGSGNLGEILRYFTSSGPTAGIRVGYAAVAQQLSIDASWVRGFDVGNTLQFADGLRRGPLPIPIGVVPFAIALWYAARRRWHDVLHLGVIVLAMTVVAIFAIAAIRGPLAPYLVRWTWVLGAAWLLVPIWVAVRAATDDRPRPALAMAVVGIASAAFVASSFAAELPLQPQPGAPSSRNVATLLRPLTARHETVRLVAYPAASWIYVLPTLAVALERQGVPVAVTRDLAAEFGRFRVERRAARRIVVAAGADIPRLLQRRDLRLLSITDDAAPPVALFRTRHQGSHEAVVRRR